MRTQTVYPALPFPTNNGGGLSASDVNAMINNRITARLDNNADNQADSAERVDEIRERFNINVVGQTNFVLGRIPKQPHLAVLTLNGVQAQYTVDYIISGGNLQWLNNSIPLEPTDIFSITYR